MSEILTKVIILILFNYFLCFGLKFESVYVRGYINGLFKTYDLKEINK